MAKKRTEQSKDSSLHFIPCASSDVCGSCRHPTEKELRRYLRRPEGNDWLKYEGATICCASESGDARQILADSDIYLPGDALRRNILTIGRNCLETTRNVLYPLIMSQLADPNASLVLVGTNGDEYDLLRALCRKLRPDGRVESLNFGDATRTTLGWNPFAFEAEDAFSRANTARRRVESLAVADGVDVATFSPTRENATRLIAGLALGLAEREGRAFPYGVYRLLESSLSELYDFLNRASSVGVPFLDSILDVAKNDYSHFHAILTTARAFCLPMGDDNIAKVTSRNDFQFDALFDEPTILALELPPEGTLATRPIVNMFVSQLIRAILCRAKGRRDISRPLGIYIDDFASSVGRIPELGFYLQRTGVANARFALALRSREELSRFYSSGEARALIDACETKIFAPPIDAFDAEYASRESGRPLFHSSEIQYPPRHEDKGGALAFFLPEQAPFQAWTLGENQNALLNAALEEARASNFVSDLDFPEFSSPSRDALDASYSLENTRDKAEENARAEKEEAESRDDSSSSSSSSSQTTLSSWTAYFQAALGGNPYYSAEEMNWLETAREERRLRELDAQEENAESDARAEETLVNSCPTDYNKERSDAEDD